MVSCDFEQNGGSYLISDENKARFIDRPNCEYIGRPDGQFMIPSNQMDELVQNHPNNPREWERQLGLSENSLGNENIHRVDVYRPQDYDPRLPTSDLSGANDKFLEGQGKTPGGQDECVINQFPNPENNPEVGRITTLDSPNIHNNSDLNNFKSDVSSSNIAFIGGGGARAPDPRDINLQNDFGFKETINAVGDTALSKAVPNGIS